MDCPFLTKSFLVVPLVTMLLVPDSFAQTEERARLIDNPLRLVKLRMKYGADIILAHGTAVDSACNIYVALTLNSSISSGINTTSSTSRLLLAKYGGNEQCLWTRQITNSESPGIAVWGSEGVALVAQMPGDIIIGKTNLHPVNTRGRDAILARYDAAGEVLWVRQFSSEGAITPRTVAVDPKGNVISGGRRGGGGMDLGGFLLGDSRSGQGVYLAKHDADGKLLWAQGMEFQKDQITRDPIGITTDGQGNIYVTGQLYSGVFQPQDMYLDKYSPEGVLQWTVHPGGKSTIGDALAVDKEGYVLVLGTLFRTREFGNNTIPQEPGNPPDTFLAKYSSQGEFISVREGRKFDLEVGAIPCPWYPQGSVTRSRKD